MWVTSFTDSSVDPVIVPAVSRVVKVSAFTTPASEFDNPLAVITDAFAPVLRGATGPAYPSEAAQAATEAAQAATEAAQAATEAARNAAQAAQTAAESAAATASASALAALGSATDAADASRLSIGIVTTLDPGEAATAEITGDAGEQVLNLGIPKGADGEGGPGGGAVTSVAGRTGDVTLSKTDVGLGNVNNTADADKPVSTAQAAADTAVLNAAAADATAKANAAAAASTPAAHASNTSNPHNVTAAQVGADPAGTASSALSAHTGAADPHPAYALESALGSAAAAATTDFAPAAHVGAGGSAHANAVASGAAGFMSGADKAKLDGIAAGATAVTIDATPTDGSSNAVSSNGVFDALAGKSDTGHNHSGTYQPLATVLTNTTASFTSAQETKLGHISVTQSVDLDAIETRVNDLDAAVVLKGVWDASAGTFPGAGAAQAGWSYIVSVAGTVDGTAFAIGDRAIAITDNASTSTFSGNWFKADYTDQVLSVAGRTGAVTITSSDLTDTTAAGRALLDDVDAAAQRTTLGLGDSATKSVGTAAGTVAAGDDSRMTNERVPTEAGVASKLHGATAKTTLVDADEVNGTDSAASWGLIRTTWANVTAYIKSKLWAFNDSSTTNAINLSNGLSQRWAPSTGVQTLSFTNWPSSGQQSVVLIEGVNLGASTITWPTINWVKKDGTFTTTIATYLSDAAITLQSSGTDFFMVWSRDGGTTVYGKFLR